MPLNVVGQTTTTTLLYKKIKQGHRQILVSYQHGHIIEALKYRELAKYETEFMMSFSMWMSRGVAQLEH